MSNVRIIPATIEWGSAQYASSVVKRRVAAYARVSTDSDEQLTSYEAQVDYYTRYIHANAGWEFVEIYADEGISATNTKKREGFKRMVRDALNGKIDLIVTKSVSRFARNTVDTLTTVRQLKEKGVEVYFEKENIYTLDSKGELLITIMSSLAQEESRSISENVCWGQRKRMQDGKFSLPYGQFLGYEKGENGLPKIVASEAKVVLLIYTLYLQGKTQNAIARHLTDNSIPTPAGKEKWAVSTVMSILQNEKYKGDAILQKRFTVDFLTKKTKINQGELPKYHIEQSHPAIVSPEMFDLVQAEIKKRKSGAGLRQSGLGCFSSRIICGECGGFYGSKVWHSTSKYRRTVWQCNNKFKNGTRCQTPHLNEAALRQAFVEAFNQIYEEKDRLLADYGAIIETLTDTAALDAECAELQSEQAIVAELTRKYVEENANTTINQGDYRQKQDVLIERYGAIKKRLGEIEDERQAREAKRKNISAFFANIERQDGLLAEFDEELWYNIVESVTVNSENRVDITFKDGTVICVDGDERVGTIGVSV